jgi:hypothetical protein
MAQPDKAYEPRAFTVAVETDVAKFDSTDPPAGH